MCEHETSVRKLLMNLVQAKQQQQHDILLVWIVVEIFTWPPNIFINIYMYIYIYTERERERI